MVTMNGETSRKAFPTAPNSPPSPEANPVTNAVLTVLIAKGNSLKNFGQCIIFMLNRERISFQNESDVRGNIPSIADPEAAVFDIYDPRDL